MELTGSTYLYALATTSVTFVGFSALLIVFRQSMGGGLTRYDTYFTLSFIQAGFIVTAGALLPPLLALYGWTPAIVWRAAAGAIAVPIVGFAASVPRRRRAATGRPTPGFVWTLLLLQLVAALALLVSASGSFPERAPAVYATAMTAMLFTSGVAYLIALGGALPHLASRDREQLAPATPMP